MRAGGAGAAGGARDKVTSELASMKQIITGLEGLPGSVTVTATTFHPNMDKQQKRGQLRGVFGMDNKRWQYIHSSLHMLGSMGDAIDTFKNAWREKDRMGVRKMIINAPRGPRRPASPADMALRLAPPQSDVLNIDEHGLHWLEALHGDGLAPIVPLGSDDVGWTPSVRRKSATIAAAAAISRQRIARAALADVLAGKPNPKQHYLPNPANFSRENRKRMESHDAHVTEQQHAAAAPDPAGLPATNHRSCRSRRRLIRS
jgi:hypothetical protein